MNETPLGITPAVTPEPKTTEQLRAEWEALVLEEERRVKAYSKAQVAMLRERMELRALSEKRRVAEETFLAALRDEGRRSHPEASHG